MYEKKGRRIEKRFCRECDREVSQGNTSGFCYVCWRKRNPGSGITPAQSVINWRQRKKEELVRLFGGECVICGYNRSNWALEFHHRDPSQKDFSISGKNIVSMNAYIEEAKKCVLVCSNCHKEIHAGLITNIPL